jgi:hypothetical protein
MKNRLTLKEQAILEFHILKCKTLDLYNLFMLSLGLGTKKAWFNLMDYIDEKHQLKLPSCPKCKKVLTKCKCEYNKLEK